jgi:hypothetical protein
MSKEVKRYVPEYCESGGELWAEMQEDSEGAWVCASDYDALLAERDQLKALLLSSREFVAAYVSNSFFGPNARKQLDDIDAALQGEQP